MRDAKLPEATESTQDLPFEIKLLLELPLLLEIQEERFLPQYGLKQSLLFDREFKVGVKNLNNLSSSLSIQNQVHTPDYR